MNSKIIFGMMGAVSIAVFSFVFFNGGNSKSGMSHHPSSVVTQSPAVSDASNNNVYTKQNSEEKVQSSTSNNSKIINPPEQTLSNTLRVNAVPLPNKMHVRTTVSNNTNSNSSLNPQ